VRRHVQGSRTASSDMASSSAPTSATASASTSQGKYWHKGARPRMSRPARMMTQTRKGGNSDTALSRLRQGFKFPWVHRELVHRAQRRSPFLRQSKPFCVRRDHSSCRVRFCTIPTRSSTSPLLSPARICPSRRQRADGSSRSLRPLHEGCQVGSLWYTKCMVWAPGSFGAAPRQGRVTSGHPLGLDAEHIWPVGTRRSAEATGSLSSLSSLITLRRHPTVGKTALWTP